MQSHPYMLSWSQACEALSQRNKKKSWSVKGINVALEKSSFTLSFSSLVKCCMWQTVLSYLSLGFLSEMGAIIFAKSYNSCMPRNQ